MVKPPQELKKKHLTPKQSNLHATRYGNRGEQLAVIFLQTIGYTILSTNVRLNKREVDIIALDTAANQLVVVEVKRRQSQVFGSPALAVTKQKMRNMAIVAKVYQQKYRYSLDLRFDTISIVGTQVEHFKNITWHSR